MMLTLRDYGLKNDDFDRIAAEDTRQIEKWGYQEHPVFEWLVILGEEYGELCKAVSEFEYREGSIADIVKEATQVATLALKIASMAEGLI